MAIDKNDFPKIIEILKENPGLHVREIMDKLGGCDAPFNTMESMLRQKMVIRERDEKKKFIYSVPEPIEKKPAKTVSKKPSKKTAAKKK